MIGLKEIEEWVKKAESVREMLVKIPINHASFGTGASAQFLNGRWILYAWEDIAAEGTDLEEMMVKLDGLMAARAKNLLEEAQRDAIVAETALVRIGVKIAPLGFVVPMDQLPVGSKVQWGGKMMIKSKCVDNTTACNACCRLGYHLEDLPRDDPDAGHGGYDWPGKEK
jgi:hypothetical protein